MTQSLNSVLFLCGMNSIRSPMAEMIARSILPKTVFVQSAGLRQGSRDHFVDEVLGELGLNLGEKQPRLFNELEDGFFDVIVALTPEANQRALDINRTTASEVIYWPMPDPSITKGRRNQILMAYRDVRDQLATKISQHFVQDNLQQKQSRS